MPDEEQLEKLKDKGVGYWNQWRKNHPNLEIDLKNAELGGQPLKGADLEGADLEGAHLEGADLEGAHLEGADLEGAHLNRAQVLGTDFNRANLTGACIEDWNTNSATKVDSVICDYIYLKKERKDQEYKFLERRPSNPNRNFEPGEFTALVQKSIHTVDLIFTEGIDWRAFLLSLKELQDEYGKENVGVQAIGGKTSEAVTRCNLA